MMRFFRGLGLIVPTVLALTACDGIEKFGKVDRYGPQQKPDFQVIIPANAPYISAQFSRAGPYTDVDHFGIDMWGRRKSDIIAAAPGRIERAYYEPAFGHQIVIDHGLNEDGVRVTTHYKHLYERIAEKGDRVARGQVIGLMGATGALGMLVHLHFEVLLEQPHAPDLAFDPHLFWMDGVGRITCFDRNKTYVDMPFRTTYPVRCQGL